MWVSFGVFFCIFYTDEVLIVLRFNFGPIMQTLFGIGEQLPVLAETLCHFQPKHLLPWKRRQLPWAALPLQRLKVQLNGMFLDYCLFQRNTLILEPSDEKEILDLLTAFWETRDQNTDIKWPWKRLQRGSENIGITRQIGKSNPIQ